MPKILFIILIAALTLLFAFKDTLSPPKGVKRTEVIQKKSPITEKIPDAAFIDLEGQNYSIHQFEGKIIILNFWATWCPPCVEEFPQLLQLAHQEQDNVVFIALSVDEEPEKINGFLEKLPDTSRTQLRAENIVIGLDTDKSISRDLYDTIMYPETFIIDETLNQKARIAGITDWLGTDVQKLLYSDKKETNDD